MKTSYRFNCFIFRLRKILRYAAGIIALMLFILGSADNNNIITTGALCLSSMGIIIYLFATQLEGIYTSDGVRIRRIKK